MLSDNQRILPHEHVADRRQPSPRQIHASATSVFDLFKAGALFDSVIGVCDEEHGEKCPLYPGVTQRLHWNFADPATFTGTHDEQLASVVHVRNAIASRIAAWLTTLPTTLRR
jgi:protein-tyrosine-phosphatase